MPERDELDCLIDLELVRYAEPRAGLEQRILVRVEAESSSRSWFLHGWRRWALAGAVSMAIVLAIGISLSAHHETSVNTAGMAMPGRESARPTTTVPDIHVETSHSNMTAKTAQNGTRRSKSIEVAERPRQPKLEVFPAPQPLTAEEEALVAIATGKSDAGRESLMASNRQLRTPLQISAIEIPPLTVPDEGN